eukprot:scaffold11172_cov156-Skeletonema_marinoi.AAC.1
MRSECRAVPSALNSRGGQGGSPFVSIKEASQKLSYLGYAIRSIWFAFPSTKRCWYEATQEVVLG